MVLDPNYFASICQHHDQKEISQFFHDLKSRENKTEGFLKCWIQPDQISTFMRLIVDACEAPLDQFN